MVSSHNSEIVVAILPFQNLSDNPKLDYFALGFTEDLITDLSRFSNLQIISLYSSQQIKEDSQTQRLKTRYIIKGSLRRMEDLLRIGVQLILADNQTLVWAERYDEPLSAIFDIQASITEKIVSTIQAQIEVSILTSSRKKNPSDLAAYEYWLKGMEQLKKGSIEYDLSARDAFTDALKIDPNYAKAYTGLSLSYFNEWSCQLWDRWEVSQKGAFEYAQKAVLLDDTDYIALAVLGRIYIYQGEYEKAEHYLRRSLQLNPNDADNLISMATSFVFLGYTEEAEKLYQRALRLNPLHSKSYYGYGSVIYFELGNYAKSVELVLKSPENLWVDMPAYIAGVYFMLNDTRKALQYWAMFQKQYKDRITYGADFEVNQSIEWFLHANPFRYGSKIKPFLEFIGQSEVNWDYEKSNMAISLPAMNMFKRSSDIWEISFKGKTIFLPDIKGHTDIAKLMAQPSKKIHCAELMGSAIEQDDHYFVLDDKAKKQYQQRIRGLVDEITTAEENNDFEHASVLKEEYDKLVESLSSSLGLNKKSRKLGSVVEKTRTAITWRIRSSIQKIEKAHPDLGKHLAKSIETGIFCSYSPEQSFDWIL